MTAEKFTCWLQGFMEIQNPNKLNKEQTSIIKEHLALVFNNKKINRSLILDPKDIQEVQESLDDNLKYECSDNEVMFC